MSRVEDALADIAGVGATPDVDWVATYAAQRDRLYGLALVILRESNDASDAVQSAFEKALRHRGSLREGVLLEPGWRGSRATRRSASLVVEETLRAILDKHRKDR